MIRRLVADRGDHGMRVDRVLARHLGDRRDLSRTRVQRLVATGRVLVDGQVVRRVAARVADGAVVEIDLPPEPERRPPQAERVALEILYEDDDLLVVDKPPGMVAHPAYRHERGTLLNGLLGHVGAGRVWLPRLVNRLDRDTSGLVLVSKSPEGHARLFRAMAAGAIAKEYLAVVVGRPRPARGHIDLPLGRSAADRRRVEVRPDGQPSRTAYEALTPLEGIWAGATLVRCALLTGRTHQIRVHLAARGWPIVGDAAYGVALHGFPRQALHAHHLRFTHPMTGAPMSITAPPPADLLRMLGEGGALPSLEERAPCGGLRPGRGGRLTAHGGPTSLGTRS